METSKHTQRLDTANHRCFIGDAGVTLYSTDRLDEEHQEPEKDRLLLLSPAEAIQFAELVLKHRAQLEARQATLDAQFEPVSQEIAAHFPDQWKRYCQGLKRGYLWEEDKLTSLDIEQVLTHTYNRLLLDDSSVTGQWYATTWTDEYSHEQQEALLWRYFNRQYREQLIEQYLL